MRFADLLAKLFRQSVGIYLVFQILGPLLCLVFYYLYAISPLPMDPMGDRLPTFWEVTRDIISNPTQSIAWTYSIAGIPCGLAGICFTAYFRLFKYLPVWPVVIFVTGMLYLVWNSIDDHGSKAFAIDIPVFGISAAVVFVCWALCKYFRVGKSSA
jgi:hypothetical protein